MDARDGSCMRCSGGSTLEDRGSLLVLTGAGATWGLVGMAWVAAARRGASPVLGLAGVADMLKRGGSTALGLAELGSLPTRKRGDRAASPALGLMGVTAAVGLYWVAAEGSPEQDGKSNQ